jgi:hypothetical protein
MTKRGASPFQTASAQPRLRHRPRPDARVRPDRAGPDSGLRRRSERRRLRRSRRPRRRRLAAGGAARGAAHPPGTARRRDRRDAELAAGRRRAAAPRAVGGREATDHAAVRNLPLTLRPRSSGEPPCKSVVASRVPAIARAAAVIFLIVLLLTQHGEQPAADGPRLQRAEF